MQQLKQQQGLTFISFAVACVVVISLMLVGFKLIPVYIQNHNVVGVLKSLQQDEDTMRAIKAGTNVKSVVKNAVSRRFQVNSITNVTTDNVIIKRTKKRNYDVTVKYEVRVPIVANLDAVVRFDNKVELKRETQTQ